MSTEQRRALKVFRSLLMLVVAEAALTSCKPALPEVSLAAEAGRVCNISAERICVTDLGSEFNGRYLFSLYRGEGEQRNRDLRCLAHWTAAKRFTLQTGEVAPCRTEAEWNVAYAGASACAVPARSIWVEMQPQSWWRVRTTIRPIRSYGHTTRALECLERWSEERGYDYEPSLILD